MIRTLCTDIAGVLLVEGQAYSDHRGWLSRAFDAALHTPLLPHNRAWVQENAIRSMRRVIRGFHFRQDCLEWKLLRVVRGKAYDVVVDLRPDSASYLKWQSFRLADYDHKHLLIPAGCAHGIQAVSAELDFSFHTSAPYDEQLDNGFAWNDPTLAIPWPLTPPILSERDRLAGPIISLVPQFADWFSNSACK